MQQGSNVDAYLNPQTAGLTDEQIVDLELLPAQNFTGKVPDILPEWGGEPELWAAPQTQQVAAPETSFMAAPLDQSLSGPQNGVMTPLGGESAPYRGLSPHDNPQTLQPAPLAARSATPSGPAPTARDVQGEPAWLKQLEAQPAAAAEARQWRDAAKDFASLDAAYFSAEPGARAGWHRAIRKHLRIWHGSSA